MTKSKVFGLLLLFSVAQAIFAQEHTYFETGGSLRTTAFSPVNASLVASAGDENTIKLWHLSDDTVTTLAGAHRYRQRRGIFARWTAPRERQ